MPTLKQLKNVAVNAALISVSIALALLAAEAFLRVFAPQNIVPRYVETAPYGIRKHIGNVRGRLEKKTYSHGFSTNALGFRGTREYTQRKPEGTYRAVLLGDSVALGHGVEDEETFSAVIEQTLGSDRPTEVLNMAVAGFGTGEQLIALRSAGFKYEPDLVILAYFSNDPMNNAVSQLFKVENGELVRNRDSFVPAIAIRDNLNKVPGYDYLTQHSHLMNLIRKSFSAFFSEKLQAEQNIDPIPQLLTDEQRELAAELINQIIVETNERGIDLLILNIPTWVTRRSRLKVNNFPRSSIRMLDNTALIEVEKEIYAGSSTDDLIHQHSYHPNAFGHQLIGTYVANYIRENIWTISER